MKTRGTDTQNHRNSNVKNVENGIAPDDPSTHNAKLRTKKMVKMIPGYMKAVARVFCFHSIPRNILYVFEEKYP